MVKLNFNSIKVQLEHLQGFCQFSAFLFQFHKGTIRTPYFQVHLNEHYQFQFHKGTIRTALSVLMSIQILEFQFHKGTIRTTELKYLPRKLQVFQFHKGTIRTRISRSYKLYKKISIP